MKFTICLIFFIGLTVTSNGSQTNANTTLNTIQNAKQNTSINTTNTTKPSTFLYPYNVIEITILGFLLLAAVVIFIVYVCITPMRRRFRNRL